MNENISESIFKSIDIILSTRLEDIAFDETIVCTVVDDSNKKNGEYYVTNGSTKFKVYSDTDKYRNNNQVRVQIPKGDWTQKKFILGQYVDENNNVPITYVSPLDSVVALNELLPFGKNDTYGIMAQTNGSTSKIIWQKVYDKSEQISLVDGVYNTITLKGEFKSFFNAYDITSGTYGLRLLIGVLPSQEAKNIYQFTVDLSSDKMFGNPYSFATFTTQAISFPFSSSGYIERIQLELYQNGDFKDARNRPIELYDEKNKPIDNILVRDVVLSFGADITKITDNTLKLFSRDSLKYTQNDYNRSLEILWYNKDEDGKYLGYSDGIYDENYNEKEYLEKTKAENRLIAQKGIINIPEDYDSLRLAANIKEAEEMIKKANDFISGDIYRILNEFKLQLKVTSLTDKLKCSKNNSKNSAEYYSEQITSTLSKTKEDYSKFLECGYNVWKKGKNPAEENFPSLNNNAYGPLLEDYFVNCLREISNQFIEIKKLIKDTKTLTHYQSIYEQYEFRMKNAVKKVLIALRWNSNNVFPNWSDETFPWKDTNDTIKSFFENTDIDTLKLYVTHDKEWYEGNIYSTEKFETLKKQYENKYSIYWFKYNKEYKPINETISIGDSWEIISQELGKNGIKLEKNDNPDETTNKYYNKKDALKNTISLSLDPKVTEEKYKAVLFFNHQMYESIEVTFENTDPVVDALTVDQASALVVEHGENSQDSYYVYHAITRQFFNYGDKSLNRKLICHHSGLTKGDEAFAGATVYWYVPSVDTMLDVNIDLLVKNGFTTDAYIVKTINLLNEYKYKSGNTCTSDLKTLFEKIGKKTDYLDNNNKFKTSAESIVADLEKLLSSNYKKGYYCFSRQIKVTSIVTNGLTTYDYKNNGVDTREFIYCLKDFYDTNKTKNSILCEVQMQTEKEIADGASNIYESNTVDAKRLAAASIFSFGVKQSNGTQYTLTISPMGEQIAVNSEDADLIELKTQLFDYDNKEVDINTLSIDSSHLIKLYDRDADITSIIKDSKVKVISSIGYYGIVGIAVKWTNEYIHINDNGEEEKQSKEIDLSTEYAIPYGLQGYRLSGPTTIIYNNMGTIDTWDYYNDSYKLYQQTDNGEIQVQNVAWTIKYASKKDDLYEEKDDLPADTETGKSEKDYMPTINDNNKLVPKPMYLDDLSVYPIVVATQNGETLWKQPIIITQNRYQSELLNNWSGELQIDKDNNTILSAMMGAGKKNGDNTFSGVLMGDVGTKSGDSNMIDKIGLYGYNRGAQSFGFDVDGTAFIGKAGNGRINFDGNNGFIYSGSWWNSFYKRDGNGNIILDEITKKPIFEKQPFIVTNDNITMNTGKDGLAIDLQNGHIDAYNFKLTSSKLLLDSSETANDYFQVKNQTGKVLINISNDEYYLQSANYTSNVAGTKYNLQDGSIDSRYFKVNNQGQITATSGDVGGWHIESWGIYKTTDSGLTTGLQIPTSGDVALTIGATDSSKWTSAPFYVTHAGALYATSGKIAGWNIKKINDKYYFGSDWGVSTSTYFLSQDGISAYWDSQRSPSWYLYFKNKFGVTTDGTLYASGVDIEGNIHATTITIDSWGTIPQLNTNQIGNFDDKVQQIFAEEISATSITAQSLSVDIEGEGIPAVEVKPTSDYVNFGGGGNIDIYAAGAKIPIKPWQEFVLSNGTVRISSEGKYLNLSTLREDVGGSVSLTNRLIIVAGGASRLFGTWYYGGTTSDYEIMIKKDNPLTKIAVKDDLFTWSKGSATRTYITSRNGYGMVIGEKDISGDLVGTWWCNSHDLSASDRRVKNNINQISSNYQQFYDKLNPVLYKYNDGNSGRFHSGFIAQEVVSALEENNLTTMDFAAVCQRDHNQKDSEWGIRYGEFIALNTWQIQLANKKLKEQELLINQLQQQLDELKSNLNI